MIVSETSIVSGLGISIKDSIALAIAEMFNERAAAEFVECLHVDGTVGTCVQVDQSLSHTRTGTSYFISTKIAGTDLVRIEYCSESSTEWHI